MASNCLNFAKLLRLKRPLTAASPFACRYHSFSSSAAANDNTCCRSYRGKVLRNYSMAWMRHPFLKQGLEMMCNVDEYELEAIVRVDMPGIDDEDLNLQIEDHAIHIKGKAEKEPENMVVTAYSGVIDLPPGLYNTDQIKASMKFGVLKIVIPKLKPKEMKDSSLTPVPPPIGFCTEWEFKKLRRERLN